MSNDEFLVQHNENEFSLKLTGDTKREQPNLSVPSTTVNSSNGFVYAVDFDEVIINISDKWFHKISQHPELKHYTETVEIQNVMKYLGSACFRNNYYIDKWLNITNEDHKALAMSLYFDDPNFYDDLAFTPFANALSTQLELIEELHIITHIGSCNTQACNRSKERAIMRLRGEIGISDSKVFYHPLESTVSKGKYMHDNKINYNVFVDDKIENLVEAAKHTAYPGYELMVPSLGYNQQLDSLINASELDFRITPFFNLNGITSTDFVRCLEAYAYVINKEA